METIEVRLVGDAVKDACSSYGLYPGAMHRSVSLLGVQCTLHFDELSMPVHNDQHSVTPHVLLACFYPSSTTSVDKLKSQLLPILQTEYPGTDIMLLAVTHSSSGARATSPTRPNERSDSPYRFGSAGNVSHNTSGPISLARARQFAHAIGNSEERTRRAPGDLSTPSHTTPLAPTGPSPIDPKSVPPTAPSAQGSNLSSSPRNPANPPQIGASATVASTTTPTQPNTSDPLVGFQEVTFAATGDSAPASMESEICSASSHAQPGSVSSLDSYGDALYASSVANSASEKQAQMSNSSFSSFNPATSLSSPIYSQTSSPSQAPFSGPGSADSTPAGASAAATRWRSRHQPSTRALNYVADLSKQNLERAQEIAQQLSLPLAIAPEHDPSHFTSPHGSFSSSQVPPAIAALITTIVPHVALSSSPPSNTSAVAVASAPNASPRSPSGAPVSPRSQQSSVGVSPSDASPKDPAAEIKLQPTSTSQPSEASTEPEPSALEHRKSNDPQFTLELDTNDETAAQNATTNPTTAAEGEEKSPVQETVDTANTEPQNDELATDATATKDEEQTKGDENSTATSQATTSREYGNLESTLVPGVPSDPATTSPSETTTAPSETNQSATEATSSIPIPATQAPSNLPSAASTSTPLSMSPVTNTGMIQGPPAITAAAAQVISFFEMLATNYQPPWLKQSLGSYKKLGLDISVPDKKTIALMEVWRQFYQKGSDYVTGLSLPDLGLKSSLPEFVTQLTNLQAINLSSNNLNETHIRVIFQLPQVGVLNLSRNQFKTLPAELGSMKELFDLDVSHNQLETLPSQIGQLTKLARLDVTSNILLTFPFTLAQCPLKQLYIADNPLTAMPAKFRVDPRSAWMYVKQMAENPVEKWTRLRLMVVGPENIGKTRLIKRLSRRDYTPLSTDGIDVETFRMKLSKSSSKSFNGLTSMTPVTVGMPSPSEIKLTGFDVKAYDFGGQEVFYPTHSFFIGPRALYLAVFKLMPDIDSVNWQALEYWLRTIRLFAGTENGKSSVIVVGTHLDEFESRAPSESQRDILTAITKRIQAFDALVHFRAITFISNKSKKGIDTLRTIIMSRAEKEDVLKTPIPSSWVAMDTFLACLIEKSKTISPSSSGSSASSSSNTSGTTSPAPVAPPRREGFFSAFSLRSTSSSNALPIAPSLRFITWTQFLEYAHMFGINGEEEVKDMATFLHDMGSILWFDSTMMRDMVILDPQWLSEMMASIISMKVRWKDGELPHSALANIWKVYPQSMHATLLSFLEHFEVAYPLKGTDKTIVPCMFSDEPGDLFKAESNLILTNSEKSPKFQRKYRFKGFLPLGFFGRMVIRIMHIQGVKLTSSWRYGIVMRMSSATGLVSFESSKKLLIVSVLARSNQDILFPSILDSIESLIKTSYRNVKVQRRVVTSLVSALQPDEFDYETVLDAFHRGERTFMCGKVAVPIEEMAPDICMTYIPELKNVKVGTPIGRGAHGVVYRGTWSSADVAVKEVIFKSGLNSSNTEEYRQFAHEVWIMSKLSHPNLVHLHGITLHPLRMIMEYCPGMDLCNFLANNPKVPVDPQFALLRLRIAIDIAKGMQYIHNLSPPVIHRDLRSPNVFVVSSDDNAENVAKIGDFGLAEFTAHNLNEALPTWQWLPPETFNAIGNFKYNERCDRWSYGIVLWEIYTGKEPFSEYFDEERFSAPSTLSPRSPGPSSPREDVYSSELSAQQAAHNTTTLSSSQASATSATSLSSAPTTPRSNDLHISGVSSSNETSSPPKALKLSASMAKNLTHSTASLSPTGQPKSSNNSLASSSTSTLNTLSAIGTSTEISPSSSSTVPVPAGDNLAIDPSAPRLEKRPSRGTTVCNVQNLKTAIASEGLRPTIPAHVPPAVRDLMARCWHADPMLRPDFGEILSVLISSATEAGMDPLVSSAAASNSSAARSAGSVVANVWRATAVSQRANYFRAPITRSLHSTIPLESGVLSLTYNPSRTEIWSGCSDGNVRIFNCKSRVRNVEVHPVSNSTSSNARIHQLLYVTRRPSLSSQHHSNSQQIQSTSLPNMPSSSQIHQRVSPPASVRLPAPSQHQNSPQTQQQQNEAPSARIWSVSDRIVVWNPDSRLLEKELFAPHTAIVRSMLFIEAKQQVWTADVNGLVCIWDVNSYALLHTIVAPELEHAPIFCMVLVDERNVWMGSYSKIIVIDADAHNVVDSWEAHSGYRIMAMSVAGPNVWTGSELRICVWDKATRRALVDAQGTKIERTVEFGVVSLITVKRPNDATHVWSGDSNGTVTVWNSDLTKPGLSIYQVLNNHKKDSVHAILDLGDGSTICTGSYGNPMSKSKDNSICLWSYDSA